MAKYKINNMTGDIVEGDKLVDSSSSNIHHVSITKWVSISNPTIIKTSLGQIAKMSRQSKLQQPEKNEIENLLRQIVKDLEKKKDEGTDKRRSQWLKNILRIGGQVITELQPKIETIALGILSSRAYELLKSSLTGG